MNKPTYWVQFRLGGWANDWLTISRHSTLHRAESRYERETGPNKNPALHYRIIKVVEVSPKRGRHAR